MQPALASIARSIKALSRVPSKAASQAAGDIKGLIAEQFAGEADPYGNAWASHSGATVKRWGEHAILDLSGAMKSIDVRPSSGAGITVTLGADYGRFHQTGTRNMPRRAVLPYAGLPARWSDAIRAACEDAFGEAVG